MGLNVNVEINLNDVIAFFEKRFEKIKTADIQKTIVLFSREVYNTLEIMRDLSRNDSLASIKVNDKSLKTTLEKVKTATMEKMLLAKHDYLPHMAKKDSDFFEHMAIALHKIEVLKALNAMSDKELIKTGTVRIVVRVKNIIKVLVSLVKNKE